MSDRTIYVYDTVTGKIQYTVDQANDAQVEGFKEKNIPVFISNKEDKKLVHPIISFVYWPINDHFEGGYLEISSIKQSEINLDIFNSPDSILSFVSKFKNDYERIEAKYNRLVIFDSSYIHRVTEVTQGIRWTFTFDIWNKKWEL